MNRFATSAYREIVEMEMIVSMSTAAMRSMTVGPRTSRSTPKPTPIKMRTAAAMRMYSAKGSLQVIFEGTGNDPGGFVGVDGLNVETMNDKAIFGDIKHERPRR